jgi:hypothetical protein
MLSFSEHMKPIVIEMYNTAKKLKDAGIPLAPVFWDYLVDAKNKIDNGDEYMPPRPGWFAGLHATLSVGGGYNPYQICYNTIFRENLNGWEDRVQMLNSWSSTNYYLVRVDGDVYMVWLNAHDQVQHIDLHWRSELDELEHEPEPAVPETEPAIPAPEPNPDAVVVPPAALPAVGELVGAYAAVDDDCAILEAAHNKKPP